MNRLGRPALVIALTSILGACAQGAPEPLGVVGLDVPADSKVVDAASPRGIYFVAPTDARAPRFGPGPRHRIIYMNRDGGTYTKGNDNSVLNTSIVPSGTSTLSAWSFGDAKWEQLMACVKLQYGRFDVEITDVEPSPDTLYIESPVGGTPQQLGLPANVGGVAPVAGDCSTVERGIAFTFAGVYNGNVQSICETVAQETAHAFGLDHEFRCEDPMTYLGGCGAKTFQDEAVVCGEDGPRQCMCGDATQNSVQALLQVLGPSDGVAPTIGITAPADGAQVAPAFTIAADADDNQGVTKVDLFIDSELVSSDATAPYEFAAPSDLDAGTHTVEVRAYDGAGSVTAASVQVNLSVPGSEPDPGADPGEDPGSEPGTPGGADDPGASDQSAEPQTLVGGCSAAGTRGDRAAGMPALLLLLASGLLARFRRRT